MRERRSLVAVTAMSAPYLVFHLAFQDTSFIRYALPMVPAVSLNYGQASILTPSDFAFARDGILAEGAVNQESMVIGDLDMERIIESRESGTVLPLTDSVSAAEVAKTLEIVQL